MIQYALICDQHHEFDAWFKSAQAFDEQSAHQIVICPQCNSSAVSKALMAPAVGRKGAKKIDIAHTPVEAEKLRTALKAWRDKVVNEADNVGEKFAEEARKIHYNDAPARGIYGQASREEVVDLVDEGIELMPLPEFPDDKN
ncbi:DUF1178 family protein [Devosia rhodophyticola]|uniref:DUF1178 family protein n=1 Tax=Devosia rhodophyticola TaxID=3026423 RepID=A0ABY7YTS0_9HYPH|nr:DUF1178 family protein [Devosia rhodophyticola]WDR04706.1 DUF1178 family protein [Devosia rhodophyticola]